MFIKRYVINPLLEIKKVEIDQINQLYDFLNSLKDYHQLGLIKDEMSLIQLEKYILSAKKQWTDKNAFLFVIYLDNVICGLIKISIDKTNGRIEYLLKNEDVEIIESVVSFLIKVCKSTNLKWLYIVVDKSKAKLAKLLKTIGMYQLNAIELKEINILKDESDLLINNYWAKKV
ncbi:hypothetical protein [Mycoplasma bradburyae]|uniref:hypothetical protein n=1 Tax=Mycoplasma bradburyae TaxID=2963128 RepID=UPI0020CC92C4|nr:hypothetical protein [Mycoplasma bradburyae]MDC4182816.1 hypothetical protein [Mycoplasma bradburyae]UTS70613.1 hypothetical protein NMG77_02560 [Mycoplasma bradburyae]